MNEPLVSVVIPAYNAEETLPAMLRCVMEQTYRELEIIVVDDGSTDGTLAAAQALAAQDGRIRVIHQENGGVAAARNRALEEARGDYVRFADADDAMQPGSTELLVTRILREGSDLVIGGHIEQIGKLTHRCNLEDLEETVGMERLLNRLNRGANSFFYGALWNKLFRRDLIEKRHVRFQSGYDWGEDFAFVADYLRGARRVTYTTETVYHYRRSMTGMTTKSFFSSIRHPVRNGRMKVSLYYHLKALYQAQGAYRRYRRTLWLYLLRAGGTQ